MNHLFTPEEFSKLKDKDTLTIIFGGTFDPIHEGHIADIRYLSKNCESLIIAPTSQNPWKNNTATSLQTRIEMIKLVLNFEKLTFNELENYSKGINIIDFPYVYSVDLIEKVREKQKGKIMWAIGEDLIESSKGWKDWNTKGVPFLVLPILNGFSGTSVRGNKILPHVALRKYVEINNLYKI
jgi:cytidyltransferase-like protein